MTNGMTKPALVLAALWLAPPAAVAQVEQAWVASYNGVAPIAGWQPSDWVHDIEVRDGFVYVTGYEAAATAYWATVKYDDAGQEQWARRLTDGQSQQAAALAVDAAGNVYVTGWQKVFNGPINAVTVKYSPDGVLLWKQSYASAGGNNMPNDIDLDAAGNLYVAGASWIDDHFDVMLLKYDPAGNLLWDRTLDNGDEQWDSGYALAIDPDGNAIVAGYSEPRAYLVKYSPAGDLLWQDEHEGYGTHENWDRVETDALGNIFVLGEISPPFQEHVLWTSKYDPDGNILWDRTYAGTSSEADYAGGLAVTPDGGVVISGQSWDLPNVNHIVTVRYDKNGVELWQRLENAGYVNASGDDVVVDAAGRIYVTGYGFDVSHWEDVITLGYSPDGDLLWTEIYAGPAASQSDYPQAMAVDDDASVYVAAHSWDSQTSDNFTTVKYSQKSLHADTTTLSAQAQATVDFTLNAGPDHASRNYFLLGTLSGTSPGTSLPGGTTLPVNWDGFTTLLYSLTNSAFLVDFQGSLDGDGMAAAQLNTLGPLPPTAVGLSMHFAYTLYAPFGFVSEAVEIEIVD